MAHSLKNILETKGYEVTKVNLDMPVAECLKLMKDLNIGSVIVMEGEAIQGLFTERAAVRNVYLRKLDLDKTPVSEVMRTDFYTLTPLSSLEEAMTIFTEKRTRHIPILEKDRLCGMVSIGDVTKWIIDQQQFEIKHLSDYIADEHHGIKPE